MKFAGWYTIIVGFLMLAQWGFFLAAGQVPEIQTAPVQISFHLFGEAATALALIISGISLLLGLKWGKAVAYIALGMLTYTVIVSPGYFAQQGVWPLVGMFAAILVLAVVCMWRLANSGIPD